VDETADALELFAPRLAERIDDTTRERRYRELSRMVFPRPIPPAPDNFIDDDPELWQA
jgi:hypothetical protein